MRQYKHEEEGRSQIQIDKYCYGCGHSEDYHEHNFSKGKEYDLVLGRCLRPVGLKNKVLGFKFVDICRCKLFVTKDMVRAVGLPEQ